MAKAEAQKMITGKRVLIVTAAVAVFGTIMMLLYSALN